MDETRHHSTQPLTQGDKNGTARTQADMQTSPQVPVLTGLFERIDHDVLDALNNLLSTHHFHMFVSIGSVMVKVRALRIHPQDCTELEALIDKEKETAWVTFPWDRDISTYLGKRTFLW